MNHIVNNIFHLDDKSFTTQALATFRYQYLRNELYKRWVDALNIDINDVSDVSEIPFLPVSFFKTEKVLCNGKEPEIVFESSGTTQTKNSHHYVADLALYARSCLKSFQLFYGDISEWCILGFLPSYLERNGSSLVWMVDEFIRLSKHPQSGFYLNEYNELAGVLRQLKQQKQKTLLIGVTFALLDFAHQHPIDLENMVVMETGGMKGRRKELTRQEVHRMLKQAFNLSNIHSEYGMTEMLSQAYSDGNGLFHCPPWAKMLVREEEDPLAVSSIGRGILNVIDLANIHSCSFIATDDAAIVFANKSFEVLGRSDNSDIRGCSLLYEG